MRKVTKDEGIFVMIAMVVGALLSVGMLIVFGDAFRETVPGRIQIVAVSLLCAAHAWCTIAGWVPGGSPNERRFVLRRFGTSVRKWYSVRRPWRPLRELAWLCAEGVAEVVGLDPGSLPRRIVAVCSTERPDDSTGWRELRLSERVLLVDGRMQVFGIMGDMLRLIDDMYGDRPFWVKFEIKEQ